MQSENFITGEHDAATDVALRASRTDNMLVAQVLAGDETAFEEIFDRYKRMVASIASRYFQQPEQIEEIIQIAFSKAYFELEKFRGAHEASLGGWLGRITSNACLDVIRSQKRKPECELTDDEKLTLTAAAADGKCSAGLLADRDLVGRLLSGLSGEDRVLLQMLYAEEMSVGEAAKALGWSQSKVKVRAWRARSVMRKILKRLL